MGNCYGIYKNVRTAAWECLRDFSDGTLPVSVTDIASEADIKIIRNSSVNLLEIGEESASIYSDEQWFIVYNDDLQHSRCRFIVAHELGHIFLGHGTAVSLGSGDIRTHDSCLEREADMFAARLLQPACVLYALDLHTADEIADLCDVSYETAHYRSVRMKELYRRSKFLSSEYEQIVYEKFRPFIEKKREELSALTTDSPEEQTT